MSCSGDFSAHYRYLRHLSRLTQTDLAAALDVSRDHVSRCERGVSEYSHSELLALSLLLEMPLAFVMEHDENAPGALMPDWFRGYFRLGKIGRRVFDSLANAGLTLASLGRHE